MPKIDLTGQRFGRLLVLREDTEPYLSPGGKPTRRWICRCDCGREVILPTRYLTSGASLSCGCLLVDTARQKVTEDNVTGLYDGTRISAISPEREANQNSVTGVKGVYWSSREQCYIAKIGLRSRSITIGRFNDLSAARYGPPACAHSASIFARCRSGRSLYKRLLK